MVTATDSSSNHHSPSSAAADTATDSPKFPRKNLPSPWAQVVRGADSEPLHQSPPSSSSSSSSSTSSASSSSSSLDSVNSNAAAVSVDSSDADQGTYAGRPKSPVWKTPSNGVAEVGPVMGAVSWPPLSESTKPSPKLTPDSSSTKIATDGSLSTPQGPVTSHAPQKQAMSNVKPNPATNFRQRSMKRGGGNSSGPGPAQNSFSNPAPNLPPPPPPPPFPVLHIPPSTFANGVPGVPDHSSRDPFRNNKWDTRPPVGGFVPPMNEHRNPSRRGNFGHHPRGDGSYYNNYASRHNQDRGNYANNRDAHAQQQRMSPRGLMRPMPPNPATFMGPQPIRPFAASPIGFPG